MNKVMKCAAGMLANKAQKR